MNTGVPYLNKYIALQPKYNEKDLKNIGDVCIILMNLKCGAGEPVAECGEPNERRGTIMAGGTPSDPLIWAADTGYGRRGFEGRLVLSPLPVIQRLVALLGVRMGGACDCTGEPWM